MGTVTTSIGSNSSIDTETTSSCSGSDPYVTTFASAPSGVSAGDLATASDSFGGTFIYLVTVVDGADITLKYISGGSGAASPCSLGSFGGGASVAFKRYYATITLWEAGLDDTGLYSSGDDAVGECYDDSAFNEAGVSINGGGTVGLDSITLSVAAGERHDGTDSTGARVLQTANWTGNILSINSNRLGTVEWLRFDCGGNENRSSSTAIVEAKATAASSGYHKTVRNCLIYHADDDKATSAINISDYRTGKTITNNIIYRIGLVGYYPTYGIEVGSLTGNGEVYVYNNTIHNVRAATTTANRGVGISASDDDADLFVKNNLVTDCGNNSGDQCFLDTTYSSASFDYNASTDTTAKGTNSLNSITSANQYVSNTEGSEDLHLKSNADALRVGVDLGTTPSGVENDIDARNRDSSGDTWDIGADQCESCSTSAGTVVPQIMNTIKQMAGH